MWFIISGIIAIIILIVIIKQTFLDFEFLEMLESVFFFVIIWGIITLLVFLLAEITAIDMETYEEKQYNIQGLENNTVINQKTNGAFVLGFGYINSETNETIKYYYFRVDELGKKLETLEIDTSSNIYIRETDDIKPCMIYVFEKSKYNKFFKWLLGDSILEQEKAKVLVVPKNTIKIEYNVEI